MKKETPTEKALRFGADFSTGPDRIGVTELRKIGSKTEVVMVQTVDYGKLEAIALNLEWLKKQAKRIKKEKGLTHAEALNEVAKLVGFRHWVHLTDVVNGRKDK